jgi:enoyl-CoA hydratase/carnithine racemase
MADEIIFEVNDGVAWITINRPDALNALNKVARDAFGKAAHEFANDPNQLVLVITGAGERAFCVGADLKEMADTGMRIPPKDILVYFNRTLVTHKPIIAAVNGMAYAGGFQLTQMCDLVIASEDAKFAITEAKVGRGSPWAAPLPWIVGPRIALELLVTAQPITAQRGYEVSLVNKVVPADRLIPAAAEMAATIAANAPLSVRAAKELVYASASLGWHEGLDEGDRIYEKVYLSEDGQEGPRAFKEKRAPVWQGR